MNSLEFIKQHVTEWPNDEARYVTLNENGTIMFHKSTVLPPIHIVRTGVEDGQDGKVWSREEFDACGNLIVNWDEAPDWATCYGIVGCDKRGVWYNLYNYSYVNNPYESYKFFDSVSRNIDEIILIESRPIAGAATSIDATVEERGNRYGAFKDGADIMQELKSVMRSTRNWSNLTPSQREALEMIQHKVGRILNGDPNYTGSWHDIQGYARLIEEELNGNAK